MKESKPSSRVIGWPYVQVGKRQFHLLNLVILAGAVWFILRVFERTYENYCLANSGKFVRAIVIGREKSTKGSVNVTFEYEVRGNVFQNTMINEPFHPGDSVYLLYLESNPGVSRTFRFIEENYSTSLVPPGGE